MLRERWPRINTSVELGNNWFVNSENSMQDALTDMAKILTDARGTSQAITVVQLVELMQPTTWWKLYLSSISQTA